MVRLSVGPSWANLTEARPRGHGKEGQRRFVHDSPLEGDGFEPSVPRQIFSAARTCAIEPRALRQAEKWINARRIEWEHRLDGLGECLKTLETKGHCDGSGD